MSDSSAEKMWAPLYWIAAAVATAVVFVVAERIDLDALGSVLSQGLGLRQEAHAGRGGGR